MDYAKKPPNARKETKILELHGDKRADPYFWMNDRDNQEVINHLKEENAYRKAVMKDIMPLADKLYREIKSRIQEDDKSVPFKKGDYFYYEKHEKGKEYPIFCRREKSLDSPEEIFCDMNEYAEPHSYFTGEAVTSHDNKWFALITDRIGRFLYTAVIKKFKTEEQIKVNLENLSGSIAWSSDNLRIIAVQKDPVTLRACRVLSYNIHTADSSIIYEENDPAFSVYLKESADKKYIFIISTSTLSTEIHYLYSDNPEQAYLFSKRELNLLYEVNSINDRFFILASFNKRNFELLTADSDDTEKAFWRSVIPSRKDVEIDDIAFFSDYMVLSERENALTNIRILSYDLKTDFRIDFGLEAYYAYVIDINEAESNLLRYSVQSINTPPEIYEYDLVKNSRTLMKRKKVKGGFQPSDYQVKRLFLKARDNTMIPVSLAYRKNLFRKGNNPLLIKGYGSYGYPNDPVFDNSTISLLDRGFLLAIAHVRGGGELGRAWYENGKLHKKKNTFYDFIDSTINLLQIGYGDKERVFGMGGSAGGLLIGAVANMRGDLYKALVPTVPFVDVVTTMLDESIPLTTFEYNEWGNPKDKKDYDYMLSYSPYDNVKRKPYPHMYILSGFHDSQVQYWEPAKWAAKLRENKTNDSLILFECDMSSGHGGPSGRFKGIRRTAGIWAFLLDLAELRE